MNRGFQKISKKQWVKDTIQPIYNTFIVLYSDLLLPQRATSHSAGYDVFSSLSFKLNPRESIKIPTGFKAYMMEDEMLTFYPRSGLGFKYFVRLANTVGIGDSDFYNNENTEGHYWIKIRNEGEMVMSIDAGESIAQCIFQKYLLIDDDNYIGKKRFGGLGSTSKKI